MTRKTRLMRSQGMPEAGVASDDRARLLASGFQVYLRKPVEPSAIVAAVASLVTRRRMTD
jgi:CheY-like chemotaxis protein